MSLVGEALARVEYNIDVRILHSIFLTTFLGLLLECRRPDGRAKIHKVLSLIHQIVCHLFSSKGLSLSTSDLMLGVFVRRVCVIPYGIAGVRLSENPHVAFELNLSCLRIEPLSTFSGSLTSSSIGLLAPYY